MIKKIIVLFLYCFIVLLNFPLPLKAQTKDQITIYFFWSKGCPHCAKEKPFLENLIKKYPEVKLESFEVDNSQENLKLLQKVAKELNTNVPGVPFTVIGNHYFVGYFNDKTTGQKIEEAVNCALINGCPNIVSSLITPATPQKLSPTKSIPKILEIPFFGQVKTKNISLPLLTIIFGLLDGFNPCAMWTLLFLISLLLGMKNKKRMWVLGVAFIITSAFVYFLFLATWLNFFLLLGLVIWVRIIIGSVALGAGVYNFYDYFVNKEGGCKITGDKKRQQIFAKIKKVTQKKQFILALIGIILLAFAVNLVELICSAGLPAVYTQILSLNYLPWWQYYLYLVGYIFFFMSDDLFVFFTAMITLHAIGIESKYARFSRLLGGIIITIIGILLLFKPEWLMFG